MSFIYPVFKWIVSLFSLKYIFTIPILIHTIFLRISTIKLSQYIFTKVSKVIIFVVMAELLSFQPFLLFPSYLVLLEYFEIYK